jgi:diguanylate cyclase (GGDEF)-like protein
VWPISGHHDSGWWSTTPHGHPTGDELVRAVAGLVNQARTALIRRRCPMRAPDDMMRRRSLSADPAGGGGEVAMGETPGLTARIAAAMTRAQSGSPTEAAADIRALLDELGTEPTYQRAAAEYVRGVAAHYTGNADEALDAVAACIEVSRAIDEPGWEANAITLRIVTLIRTGRGGDSVDDLVAAEHALTRTTDQGLIGWAHTGLGYAYDLLRLFELCIPHFEKAVRVDTDPLDLPESDAIDRLNLAESNLRWAHEMERLGDPAYDEQIRGRRTAARRWAGEAMDVIGRDGLRDYWPVAGRLWLAASDEDTDPAGAVEILRDCRDEVHKLGDPELTAIAGAYLARAYAALGRTDDALQAADRAVADLPPTADPPVEALVRHTAVHLAADAGDPGAVAGLQYARSIARGWWAERLRGLYAVRTALASHELSIRHDAEWRAAREDPLTGVGNRRALDERMAEAATAGQPVAVVAIDVDDLKAVNDEHGHAGGDDLLQTVARLLTEQCRADDVVTRIGGDEFVVVLDDPGDRGAVELVARIRRAATRVAASTAEPWSARLRLSIGHAATTEGFEIGRLLAEADTRMYADKRRPR